MIVSINAFSNVHARNLRRYAIIHQVILRLCTHVSVRRYQASDVRFAASDFLTHPSDFYYSFNTNFHLKCDIFAPRLKKIKRKSDMQWCKSQSEACEHFYITPLGHKNHTHQSDIVRIHVYIVFVRNRSKSVNKRAFNFISDIGPLSLTWIHYLQ